MKKRTIEARGKERVVQVVSRGTGLDEAAARALIERGAVFVDGRRCKDSGQQCRAGQKVTAVLEEAGVSAAAAPVARGELRVLFEDEHAIAVDKPAGIAAQPTPGGADNLLAVVSERLGRPAGLVHRLDKETSGVTVFGKTAEATSALAAQFREGTAKKRYLAAVAPGLSPAGRIDLPISKDPSRPGRYRASSAANGVPASTEYRRLFEGADHALVSLEPETGRTHQLRAHLTALGCPIAGDVRYGGQRQVAGAPAERCLLHAHALRIRIGSEERQIVAPVPADLARIFEADGVPVPDAWP